MVQRASYRAAIEWIAENDDTEWIGETAEEDDPVSVTACLVADLFGVTQERVADDIRRRLKKNNRR